MYTSIGDVRDNGDDWNNNILVRTAEDTKDYSGGRNHYVKLDEIGSFSDRLTA